MSFLSTFGGANPYKLTDFAGNQNAFTNTYLRDFTAYNDNFMLIFPNNGSGDNVQGGLWVGNRLNSLHRVALNGYAYSHGNNVNGCGGDPMVAQAAGFSEYGATSYDLGYMNTSLTDYEYKNTGSSNAAPSFIYYINVAVVNTNTSNNTQDWSRFVYHAASQTLYVFKKTNNTLFIRRMDSSDYYFYTPTMTGVTTGWTDNGNNNSGYFNGYWMTMPEIDPVSGDIMCYIQDTSNTLGYVIKGGANNTFNITEVGNTALTSAVSTRYKLAIKNSNEFALAPEVIGNSTYSRVYYTTDGGISFADTGDALTNGYYSSVGYANGYYYSIFKETSTGVPGWTGILRRTTNFSAWEDIFDTPVTNPSMIRDNGFGTASYLGGGHYSTVAYNSQPQIHRIA